MNILVLNSGSSSFKLALYAIDKAVWDSPSPPIWNSEYAWKEGAARGQTVSFLHGKPLTNAVAQRHAPKDTLRMMLDEMVSCGAVDNISAIHAVGHRVVHGGSTFKSTALITPQVKQAIQSLIPLAPLHNPDNLAGIEIIESLLPTIPQVAVFDTTFHTTLSEATSTYPGPYKWKQLGIKRYGFHGISHHYCMLRSARLLKKDANTLRIISCHLGNGSSLAAIDQGKCIDTTMGFTPMDGMMMGSRPGALDPGIAVYLEQQKLQSADTLFHALNFESGLKGISGISSDMRDTLRKRSEGDSRAILAYEMFVHSLRRNIGAMAGVLGNVDALVFTAGIGENVASIRSAGCHALRQMGLDLDDSKNEKAKPDVIVSQDKSIVQALVIKAEEDWTIACECFTLLST